jgi:NAD(P)H-dependent FMN reductase
MENVEVSEPLTVLLVSGSTRAGSGNTAALRTAALVAPEGVRAVFYRGLLELPAFVPDGEQGPAVTALREGLSGADAVLFCTPEYAGTLPGSLKNLLDWTVGTGELYGKPVAFTNVAAPGRGAGAEATLRLVLGYVGAEIIEGACTHVFIPRDTVGPDGLIADPATRVALTDVLAKIAAYLGARTAPDLITPGSSTT